MDRVFIDKDNLSLERIEERCIHCGMCKKTCESLNNIGNNCVNCGQCILTCPTGALVPKYCYKKVLDYLNDTDYQVIVFVSPAVRVSIGDEFGFAPGTNLEKELITILKQLKFDYVLDTCYGADLTIMEEAWELVNRLENSNNLPLMTSCCPSWVQYVNKFLPEYKNNISTVKSPIGIEATMVKNYFSKFMNIPKEKIITVALTPCVSKKTEITTYEDADYVITSSELSMMIRECNLSFNNVIPSEFDELLGESSSSGVIFGSSGGVMEAMLRTAYYYLNKENPPEKLLNFKELREDSDVKTAEVDLKKKKINIMVINKLSTVKNNLDKLKNYDVIEVMTCPGGCLGGAGLSLLPINEITNAREKRKTTLYDIADKRINKSSYENEEIKEAYNSFLSRESKNEILHNK
jgi:iron-only hydrogenase group A